MKIRIRRVITERLSEAFFRYAAKGWFICNATRPIYETDLQDGDIAKGRAPKSACGVLQRTREGNLCVNYH